MDPVSFWRCQGRSSARWRSSALTTGVMRKRASRKCVMLGSDVIFDPRSAENVSSAAVAPEHLGGALSNETMVCHENSAHPGGKLKS